MIDPFTALNTIYAFIKNPTCGHSEDLDLKDKGVLLAIFLGLAFVINSFFIIIIGIIEQLGVFQMKDHAVNKMFENFSPLAIIFLAVLVAPVLEELIFRAPITLFCKYNKSFRYIFYGFAIVFGYVHITNFEITTKVLLVSPILVAPQTMLGLLLGMIRVKLGLIYSILFHGIYNAILVIPGVLYLI